uniref:Uncharacterized protein n=1 Tax=Rhizophora mucronata TaxID=61149 RepID=A0A2P2NCZ9_RHIMU
MVPSECAQDIVTSTRALVRTIILFRVSYKSK